MQKHILQALAETVFDIGSNNKVGIEVIPSCNVIINPNRSIGIKMKVNYLEIASFRLKKILFLGLIITLGLVSCNGNENSERNYTFDFNKIGTENWKSLFSDYPVGKEDFYELIFEHSALPEPLDTNLMSLKISGNNHSDDLLSVIYRKFDDLQPNKKYLVTFDIDFASRAVKGGLGSGGSPDLSIGAGGISFVPENTIDNRNYYQPNFESRLQSGLSNEVFKVLGKIGGSDSYPPSFTLLNRNNLEAPIEIETNSEGEAWLMIATDSGFEGVTTLYYKSIKISFK